MDPASWSSLSVKKTTIKGHSARSAMANLPAVSSHFSRQDMSLAGLHQSAAQLLLQQSGAHSTASENFMSNATSELLKAGYTPAGLLAYTGVNGNQPNLTHSNLLGSFQQKDSDLNELREGFSRSLHSLSMLANSQSPNSISHSSSDQISSGPQNPVNSGSWRLPSPGPSSSMFGVLPHESVGSKTEKSCSSKSQGKGHSNGSGLASAVTTSKASNFVYGTSPSAGTTAKTVISNDLLSSPTYLPQPQYNSFLNVNEKKEVYDQNNSAIDYTNPSGGSSSQKRTLDDETFNSTDSQSTTKCETDRSHQSPMPHQSPMMASQSPAMNHHSPMVSSAVISPVEPPVYSPASNLRFSGDNNFDIGSENNHRNYSSGTSHCSSTQLPLDPIKAHPSPQNSIQNHNSPMSSTAGSPFVSQSPRESLSSAYVNPELPSSHYHSQHPILSPTNCNLSHKENYDLMNNRVPNTRQQMVTDFDSIFSNSENIDDVALHELTNLSESDSKLAPSNSATSDAGLKITESLASGELVSSSTSQSMSNQSIDGKSKNLFPTTQHNDEGTKTQKMLNSSTRKSFSKSSKPSGKPAGFFNSYLNFVKKSPPKGQRKRGRPRKHPIVTDNVTGSYVPPKPAPAKVKSEKANNIPGNFTFSDSEEEQENSHNISDNVQLALKSLTDDKIDKNGLKTTNSDNVVNEGPKVQKRKIYENSVNTSPSESFTMDVYNFDFECGEKESQPSSFRMITQKRKYVRKNSPGSSQSKINPVISASEDSIRRLSMRKCVEKLIQKREQRTAKRKKVRRVNSDKSSDDDSDDDWIPINKASAVPREESDNDLEVPAQQLDQPKPRKSKSENHVKKKSRALRRESVEIANEIIRESSFKTGDFIVNIKDMHKEKPYIWRINGKDIIQKYEPFDKDGKILYQGGGTLENCNNDTSADFLPVNVRYNNSQRGNCVVEYLGPVRTDPKFVKQMMIETSQFQAQKENFEVYLQTLISQALDPNFISEIVKENDEYFLSHMREIDDMAIKRKEKLIEDKDWKEKFLQCVQYYPCVNIITSKSLQKGPCQACSTSTCVKLVQFYGQPYDYTTLRRTALSAHSYLLGNKEFTTCEICSELVNLYNRLHHQKYNFYIACHTKVNHVRVSSRDMRLESHVILEKCLQDSEWINKMFEEIMSLWLECDRSR